MHLELTQSATEDLRAIPNYTLKTWGEDQQESYLDGVYLKFEEISNAPAQWRYSC